jgi:hypothetical protein
MYRGFNVTIDPYKRQTGKHEEYYQLGNDIFTKDKRIIKSTLEAMILKDGTLDGTKLQEQWFPLVEADLFISHSHKNEEAAIILAGYLRKVFGITSFIDSTVWSYSNDLLQQLDNQYCRNEGEDTYDYQKRNFSTSHVYLMLSGALSKMIDNTECVFFLNTPDSIKADKVIDSTLSPWIYSEILTTQFIRKRAPKEHPGRQWLTKSFSQGGQILNESKLAVTYEVEMSHLTSISAGEFPTWLRKSSNERYKLDALYKMYPLDGKFING